jgi:hypothetical protein
VGNVRKLTPISVKGTLADGGTYTATVNCDVYIACVTGTLTVQQTINGTFYTNPVTIATGTYLTLNDLLQNEQFKITGGTAAYHAYA